MPTLRQLEDQLLSAKVRMERRDKIVQLSENPLFRQVILDDYMIQQAARYVAESADPALNQEQRADALAVAQSAGHLKRYLNMQIALGNQSEQSLEDLETNIEEMRIEEQDASADPVVDDYETDMDTVELR